MGAVATTQEDCTRWCKLTRREYSCDQYGCTHHHDPKCPNVETEEDDDE